MSEHRVRIIVRVERFPEKGGAQTGESSHAYQSVPVEGLSILSRAIERALEQIGARKMWCRNEDDRWTYAPPPATARGLRDMLERVAAAPAQMTLEDALKRPKKPRSKASAKRRGKQRCSHIPSHTSKTRSRKDAK